MGQTKHLMQETFQELIHNYMKRGKTLNLHLFQEQSQSSQKERCILESTMSSCKRIINCVNNNCH